MKQKSMCKNIAVGVAFGVLGIVLTVWGIHVGETDSFADLRIVPAVIAALFVGPLAGLVAGGISAVGRLLLPLFGTGVGACVGASVGTLGAALLAVAARKWIFNGERPAFVPAALCAVVCEMVEMACVLAFGFKTIADSFLVLNAAMAIQCVGAMVLTALASFAFRAKQLLKPNLIALALALCIVTVGLVVWLVQDRMAVTRAIDTVTASMSDVMTGVDYPTEAEMLRSADQQVRRWKSAGEMAKADLAALAREMDYDFVGVVGTNGVILAASQQTAVGRDLSADEDLKEFLEIGSSGRRYCIQLFRSPSFPVKGKENVRDCKHVGLGFRDGSGFVLLANSFGGVGDRDYILGDSVLDWHVGESGSFVLVDPTTKTVISGIENDRIGKTTSEVGLDDLRPCADGYFMVGTVFGRESLVRRESLGFIPIDVYAIVPYLEVMCQRDLATVLTVILVSVIFLCVAMAFSTIIRQGRDIARLRAQEDERRQKDMDLAKSIQGSSLVREFPPGVHALMRTAREVGGDFYDCFPLGEAKLMLVIADVSGKGIPAALFMMRARTEFRAVSKETHDLSAIMTEVNARLCKNNIAEMFVTAWIGVIDLASGDVEWVSAGHNPPYLLKADGSVSPIVGKRSLVLAGMDGVRYRSNAFTLAAGDRIFLYTDGVTEAQSPAGDFYGEPRLESALAGATGTMRALCEKVFASVDAFAAGAPQADDITVLAAGPLEDLRK